MGTRADFYVGRGPSAEWLGSVAWDGHPDTRLPELDGSSEQAYRASVEAILAKEDHATRPADGWPWPWEDSRTTDYAYAFDAGEVWTACFGGRWLSKADQAERAREEELDGIERMLEDEPPRDSVFPNMKERQNVTFGQRSGILVFGVKP